MIIRRAFPADIHQIIDIAAELNLSYWSFDDYVSELNHTESVSFTAENTAGKIVGFLIARLIITEKESIEIYNIGVSENSQNNGIGRKLVRKLFDLAHQKHTEEIWLEVRSKNEKAISFYKTFGFTIVYTRKNYYSNPPDDAFVMSRSVTELF